jgi:hypothetical protein
MKKLLTSIIFVVAVFVSVPAFAIDIYFQPREVPKMNRTWEITGYVALEGRGFFEPVIYAEQERHDASIILAPEFYVEIDPSLSFTAAPFYRFDDMDTERTHYDVRELFFLKVFDNFEASVGFRKVFWGVTETSHLVDIINQTDLVENPDGEDKLGEPMVSFSAARDYGTFDLYLMPYFRERTFPGKKGRLRSDPRVDVDMVTYGTDDGERHGAAAFRYSHSLGDFEFALSHFWGLSRAPTFNLAINPKGELVLAPHYEPINQTGLEFQIVAGQLLLKFEGIFRNGQGSAYGAATTGFEYTFAGFLSTKTDFGFLAEWLYDDRGDEATTPMQNDYFVGMRFVFNDQKDTNLLMGMIDDVEGDAQSYFIEANRRYGERIRATVEVRVQDVPPDDNYISIQDDDFLMLELAYYL